MAVARLWRDNPTQAVTDEMYFAPACGQRVLDGRIQLLFDQEVRHSALKPIPEKNGLYPILANHWCKGVK